MDMVDVAKQNDGDKYVLVVVDIFSRFALSLLVKSSFITDTYSLFDCFSAMNYLIG